MMSQPVAPLELLNDLVCDCRHDEGTLVYLCLGSGQPRISAMSMGSPGGCGGMTVWCQPS